ncbi:MAG: SGNH/GDSL hydrolase family protein [Oscillospiraceae bacterium]|nr:SGNH/GDSL hydrolase family protein [Oscillospiraceae bacterium]MCD8239909.1 SGNH/GDSL hydrolase family protein [Oscillospiraceae bacterium]
MKKRSKESIYMLWSGAIVFCVILAIFALIFSSCAKQESEESVVENQLLEIEHDNTPETAGPDSTAEAVSVRLTETEDAGRDYLDRLVFLGDSTTYGIGYYYEQGYTELCPSSQVWTPTSGTLTLSQYNIATIVYPETGEELTITEAVTQAEPEYLYITLGVNGVSFMDEEWFKRDYSALVESIRAASPDTKIVLNSIYPVAASYAHLDEISNEKIRAANGWIEQVATDTGCRFLYSYEAIVDESGNLPEERQNGDGIHLNGEAFTEVMYYIRTHADI